MEITATAVEATDTDLAGTRYVMIDEGAAAIVGMDLSIYETD